MLGLTSKNADNWNVSGTQVFEASAVANEKTICKWIESSPVVPSTPDLREFNGIPAYSETSPEQLDHAVRVLPAGEPRLHHQGAEFSS
jgi:hypothetical protein